MKPLITGLGCVTTLGTSPEALHRGLVDAAPTHLGAGTVTTPDVVARDAQTPRRWLEKSVAAALEDARWPVDVALPMVVLAGQAVATPGSPASQMFTPSQLAVRGSLVSVDAIVSHACASGLFAMDLAVALLRMGAAPAVLVAGANTANDHVLASMRVVKAVSGARGRPFDRARDGITVGEGAGALLLETPEHAARRGGPARAAVLSSATQVAGASATASSVETVLHCMHKAIEASGIRELGHVHAHATGTVQGDAAELEALSRLATARSWANLPVTSHKGSLGHLMQASSFPAVISAITAMDRQQLPGTTHLHNPMAAERLLLPGHGHPLSLTRRHRTALVNAFGFGGNNASVVLESIAA